MSAALQIIPFILCGLVGYFFGYRAGKRDIDREHLDYAISWRNTAVKQANQIDHMMNKLEYFTVGDIGDLYEYLKEDEIFDDSYPILGIVGPLTECNIDFLNRGENNE